MYYLYIKRKGTYSLYGSGDMLYIMELLNDYLDIHRMYGNKRVIFKVTNELER